MANDSNKCTGLGLALSLGAALLALSLLFASLNMNVLRDPRVSHWIEVQQIFGLELIWPFVAYGLALLLLHLLFGVCIWLLALLSGSSMNSRNWSRRAHVIGWFATLTFWLLLANAALFPRSITGDVLGILIQPVIGDVSTFDLASGALLCIVVLCGWRIIQQIPVARRIAPRVMLYSIALTVAASAWQWMRIDAALNREVDAGARPNIIIVGIDSLRPDFTGVGGRELGYTPELDLFLREATLFTDAITPLGRTFASWMAILTGRAPVATGVRDNLVPRDLSRTSPTLAERLKAHGYHTAYATDETRFSNIDGSYGFDQVIGPKMGITDFILGTFNDLPLTNLFANSWVAKVLFPNTYANRAAATTYRPGTFVEMIQDDLEFTQPALVGVHLTLPHDPFHWHAEDALFSRTSDTKYEYAASVIEADRQFAALMAMFERRGLLRNAIVVVLSDHGEALNLPSDNVVYGKEAKKITGRLRVAMSGHGNSVLSPQQYSVVLAVRGYGPAARLVGPARRIDVPVSLEDVTPTVLDLNGLMPTTASFDGHSLAAVLKDWPNVEAQRYARVRYTETGFPVDFVAGSAVAKERNELAATAIDQFDVDSHTGRVVLRKDSLPRLLRVKQRAAIQGDWLLAAVPDASGDFAFVMVNRRGEGLPRMMDSQVAAADPVAAILWNSLHGHFAGEFTPGPKVSAAH
jgi:arylsulfatase A-like enzyme